MLTNRIKLILILFLILSGIAIVAFVSYKATVTSFTHDESFTYLNYVHQSFFDIIIFKTPYTNNHILNTLLIKYSENIFGSSELALRLPNIIALAIYLVYSTLIFAKHKIELWIPVFIIMSFNPFLLDFFGLARGYGLSIGLMIFSTFYLINHFETKKQSDLILFNAGAILAVFANFTLLNFYVAGLITFNIILLSDFRFKTGIINSVKSLMRENKINFYSIIIALITLFEPVRRMAQHNILDYGGKNGLRDTFASQVYNTFYNTPIKGSLRDALSEIIVIIIVVNFIIFLTNFILRNRSFFTRFKGLIISNLIILLILTATVVQHFLFGYDFLKDRFALFLYPLIMLNTGFLIYYLASFKLKYFVIPVAYILVPFFSYNLIGNLNTRSYKDWKFDMDTKEMLEVLANEKGTQKQIKLGINWLFEPTTNYYRITKNYEWLVPTNREGISEMDDFIYVMKKDSVKNKEIKFVTHEGRAILYKN